MSFSSFSDNDDDLFEESTSSSTDSQSSSTTSEEIKSLLESIDISDIGQIDQMFKRSKIALALYNGSNTFTYTTESFNKTVFNTLNSLTNNVFQYHLFADILEETIIKRMILLTFSKDILEESSDMNLDKIKEALNVEFDQRYVSTYFGSYSKITDFVINYNIYIYTKICQEIGREPLTDIIERNFSDTLVQSISSDSYINSIFKNIASNYNSHYFEDGQ